MKFRKDLPEPTGGKFLKLKDGDAIYGVLMGEPYEFFQKWVDGKTQLVEEGCPGGKFRFRLNMAIGSKEGAEVKILEGGWQIYEQLSEINEEYDISKTLIKISRKGEKLDTNYTVVPILNKKVAMEQIMASVSNQELHDLKHDEDNNGSGVIDEPMPGEEDEIPF